MAFPVTLAVTGARSPPPVRRKTMPKTMVCRRSLLSEYQVGAGRLMYCEIDAGGRPL